MNAVNYGRWSRRLTLLGVLTVTGVLFIDLCAVVFGCGCRSQWNGAADACNIHAMAGPHCPWCAHPFAAGAIAFVSIAAAQTCLLLHPGRLRLALRVALAVAVVPVLGGFLGAIQGFLWDYWGP